MPTERVPVDPFFFAANEADVHRSRAGLDPSADAHRSADPHAEAVDPLSLFLKEPAARDGAHWLEHPENTVLWQPSERGERAFDSHRQRLESSLAEANRLGELVAALEARIANLTEPNYLALAETLDNQLEQQGTDRIVQVQRTTAALEAHKRESIASPMSGITLSAVRKAGRAVAAFARQSLWKRTVNNETQLRRSLRHLTPQVAGGVIVAAVTVLAVAGMIGARTSQDPVAIAAPSQPAPSSPTLTVAPAVADIRLRPSTRTTREPLPNAPSSRLSISGQAPARPVAIERSSEASTPTIATAQRSRRVQPGGVAAQPRVFTGTLVVQSNPAGAEVFVDRQYVGATPLQLPQVRAGSHVVRIEREGHQRWTASVLVTADQRRHVNANLQPER